MSDVVDSANDRSRWIALYVLCTGGLMIVLDATVVNVALPVIKSDLGFTQASLAWVVNAYMIAFGGLLLLSGRLGDIFGRKNIFLWGLGLFTVASVLCGAAQSQEMLVAARFLQGAGGAMTSAVILGMLVTMFSEPREQAKAMGVYGFIASAGGSIGLLLGGILTESINWHWIFFVNVPIGIATGYLANKYVLKDKGIGFEKGTDAPGAALITGSLMLIVYTLVGPATNLGWDSTRTWAYGGAALVLLALFLVRETTTKNPLVPLRFFKSRNIAGTNLIMVATVAGMFGTFFLGSLYLEQVMGYDALQIGLAFLPMTIILGILSLKYSEMLMTKFGAKQTMVPGLGLVVIAVAYFARIPVDGEYVRDVLPAMILLGIGNGISFPGLMTLAMAGVKPEESGLASGVVNSSAQVGGAVGLAVLATIAAKRTASELAKNESMVNALTSGYHLAFIISTALLVLAWLIAVFVLKPLKTELRHAPMELESVG